MIPAQPGERVDFFKNGNPEPVDSRRIVAWSDEWEALVVDPFKPNLITVAELIRSDEMEAFDSYDIVDPIEPPGPDHTPRPLWQYPTSSGMLG